LRLPLRPLVSPLPNQPVTVPTLSLDLLQTLVVQVSQARGFEAALQCVIEQVCHATAWTFGEVWLPSRHHDRLDHSGLWYTTHPSLRPFGELSLAFSFQWEEGLPGRVWATQTPEWISNLEQQSERLFLRAEAARQLGFKTAVGVPLYLDGPVLAVLVFFSDQPMARDQVQVSQLQTLITQLGALVQLKQTEATLAEQQGWLDRLVNGLPGIVFTAYGPPDRNLRYLSDGCERLTGYSSAELTQGQDAPSLTYNDITHPDDLPRVLGHIQQAIAGRRSYEVEYRLCTRAGQERWVWEKGTGHYDDGGNLLGLEGFITDITPLKQAEAALRDRERFMGLLLNSVPQQLFWKDREGVYLGCNQLFAAHAGLSSPADIVGRRDRELNLYTPEQIARFHTRDQAVMSSGQPSLNVISAQPHADGSSRWVNSNKFPVQDDRGQVIGVLGTLEDVSDRLAAQEALARRESYFAALMDVQRQLLTLDETWDGDRYTAMLAPLGEAAGASCVYIYECLWGQTYSRQLAEWSSPGIESTRGHSAFAYIPHEGPFQPWLERLQAEQVINQTVDQFPPGVGEILGAPPANVRSILLLPLMVKGELYGTVGFSNCGKARPWTRSEVALLQVAASALALSIERYQTERSLQLAESNYRSIFENAVEGIFQSTVEGRYLTVNPMLAKIYGYESPAALMAELTDIQHQLYVAPQRRETFVRQMLKQGSVLGFESQVYRQDGTIIWISESARVVYDPEGQPASFEGTVEDITARKQAEQALLYRDRLLQGVAQASQHLLTAPDVGAAIPQMLSILGTAADADRVYLYENHDHLPSRELAMSMRYEWTHPDISPSIQQPHWQNQPYSAHGLQRWHRTFLAGQSIRALTRHLPQPERSLLSQDGILSILMVPIFIDQALWGYVGFDACRQERRWTASDESILVTIAASLGGALKRQQAEEQIRHQAFHDALTDLPNRALFDEYLPVAIAQAHRDRSPLAVMFLDLDRFKTINDTLGHAMGDRLLQQATHRIHRILREGDIIARWGGDEFTFILSNLQKPEDAAKVAERLAALLKPPFFIENQELYITSSIGIALYPQDGTDGASLLRHADVAMYRAKAAGRNTYRFYNASHNDSAAQQLTLEKYLHQALANGELELFFQPQVNLHEQRITQLEALIRWKNSHLGWVMPNVFIPIAEEVGLIVEVGDWVLQAACAQLQQWHQAGFYDLRMAVNLSARQLQQPDLVDRVAHQLTTHQLSADSLELEITETAALLDIQASTATLNDLRQLGTHVVMDDFGTGYSSLSYLKQFPVSGLKIDRAFVQDIPHNTQDVVMLRAIAALGKELNLTVVAEGVETPVQQDCLFELGCHNIQGYWISHPLAAPAMTTFLQRHWPIYDQ
jgi:diguanylate cyclase (GGDEF)-like protein/PAS domain S-box-containing protein